MQTTSREKIFEMAARKLRQSFEEISATLTHSGMKGTEGEKLIREFLNQHLPKRFHVGGGLILDEDDTVSKQTDVIVYDALNCPVYWANEDAMIIPNDNVAAVIEVKARLDKAELEDAAAKIKVAKQLKKRRASANPTSVSVARTFGCVFAFRSDLTLRKLTDHVKDLIVSDGLGLHIDYVAVLDRGTIGLHSKPPHRDTWNPAHVEDIGGNVEGSLLALGYSEFGEKTLDAFFRILLAHLIPFREYVPHPGIKPPTLGPSWILPLHAISFEKDPVLHRQKVEQYLKDYVKSIEGGERR